MRTDDDQQIVARRQIVLQMAEGFADETPNAIAFGGRPDLYVKY